MTKPQSHCGHCTAERLTVRMPPARRRANVIRSYGSSGDAKMAFSRARRFIVP